MHIEFFIIRCVQGCERFVGFYLLPFITHLNVPLKKQAREGDKYGSFHNYNHHLYYLTKRIQKICWVETDMNRFCSHQNQENLILYEGLPPQSLSEARRAGSFF